MTTIAIIPARGGSKGLPNKNILEMNGKPMIAYSIEAAKMCPYIEDVVVSTDSEAIAETSKRYGASVPFLRPAHLASDTATTIDVLKHAVEVYESMHNKRVETVVLLQPTSPLRNDEDVANALELFIKQQADSLQSITVSDQHPYLFKKYNTESHAVTDYYANFTKVTRRQDMEEMYALNGAIYIFRKELLTENKIVGKKNIGFVMPKNKSIDIDDIYDFILAEQIMIQSL